MGDPKHCSHNTACGESFSWGLLARVPNSERHGILFFPKTGDASIYKARGMQGEKAGRGILLLCCLQVLVCIQTCTLGQCMKRN